ncbi:MAG: septum site-determining protein MinD [Anaerolineae bacterium]|nr:septum site-determining protein MinD [Anaerolineae bacterium]
MAARIITITSGKGGVGKTTSTANLGVSLALMGKRVVVMDGDIGLRNLDVIMGLENRIIYDVVDVAEGVCRLRQALVRDKKLSELYLLPAAQTRDKSSLSPNDVIQICSQLVETFDFILIDSPAGIEQGFRNAIAPAEEVIVVVTPEVSSVRDADRVIGLLEERPGVTPRLLINRVNSAMIKRKEMLSPDDVVEILAIELLGIIPEDESIIVSTNHGTPIAHDEKLLVSRAYHNIARRLLGEDVPFLALSDSGESARGWLSRLFRTGDR